MLHLTLAILAGCDGDGTDLGSDTDRPDSDTATPTSTTAPLADADGRWIGVGDGDWAGRWIAEVGDVDGDGLSDVVVSALWHDATGDDAGATYLLRGPATRGGRLDQADAIFLGESAHDASGVSATGAGDVDGDGFADLVIGADGHDLPLNNAGTFYLVRGPVAGTVHLADADAKGYGEGRGDLAGVSVIGLGDTNEDGLSDVLVGARYHDAAADDAGAAYLIHGPFAGEASLGQVDAKILGARAGDWLGIYVTRVGDVDGDGRADMGIAARYEDAGGTDAGASYLVTRSVAGTVAIDDVSAAKFIGEGAFDEADHITGGGDVDGDGDLDLWIGARLHDGNGVDSGAAYLVRSPVAGDVPLANADAKFLGQAAGDEAGFRLDGVGDVDGDGTDDLAVAGWRNDAAAEEAGAVYLILGPVGDGTFDLGAADRIWHGEAAGDWGGSNVAGGDIDGDGLSDLLFTAAYHDEGGIDAGAAYVFLGANLTW